MSRLLPFLLILIITAFFTKLDFFFYLVYVLFVVYFIGHLWARRSLAAVRLDRIHDERAFWGEPFKVQIRVQNTGWLPVLWLRLTDSVPAELASGKVFRRVVSLKPRESLDLEYDLHGRRRGYYRIGPLVSVGGDLLGSRTYEHREVEEHDPDGQEAHGRLEPHDPAPDLGGARKRRGVGRRTHAAPCCGSGVMVERNTLSRM